MEKANILELVKNGEYKKITPEMMYELEKDLSADELIKYKMIVDDRKKNQVVAWVLWALAGAFGGELIYLGLEEQRLIAFITLIVGWVLYYFVVGIFIVVGIKIWSIFLVINGLKESEIKTKVLVYNEMFN
ncbi:MAG: hypothetical protein ACK5HR_05435 [Mycoplasmatales bacterium]